MSRFLFVVLAGLLLAGCTVEQAPASRAPQGPDAALSAPPTVAPTAVVEATPIATRELAAKTLPFDRITVAAATATPTPALQDDLTTEQRQLLASLPSRGPAPELRNDVWLNSEPLRLAELRGKVVLLDMWTYG